jgi:hypothetical protein
LSAGKVVGMAFLRDRATFKDEVDLGNVSIGSGLDMSGATFEGVVNLNSAKVDGAAAGGPSPQRTSSTIVPMPRRTAISAPVALAQKPSILPSASAFAAAAPEAKPEDSEPGTGTIWTPAFSRSMPASSSSSRRPSSTTGTAAMRLRGPLKGRHVSHPDLTALPASRRCPGQAWRAACHHAIQGRRTTCRARGPPRNRPLRRVALRRPWTLERYVRSLRRKPDDVAACHRPSYDERNVIGVPIAMTIIRTMEPPAASCASTRHNADR